ncbi:MAG: NADH-quinone oxidoreductase subunit NuoG [Burkholderiaceae bacterium]
MVEIEIDGIKVEVQEGSMVMDAANKLGTYIPHFCYHKKLSIAANCRMCLVEVEKAPKPLPACATPVTSGMIVRTKSDRAVTAQKGVMEFLLINHPLDCPICDQGGECQLQDLAIGYGASASRYHEEKRVVFHKDAGPLISMEEMTRCIHCTRCVRFGQEIAGVMELGMLNRGEHAEITAFVGKTIDSELSGNMIDLCPVGALTSKPFRFSARTWELSRRKSISPHDGLGANLVVQVTNNRVMRVLPLENEDINECWLSDKDRFSYEGLNGEDRLTKPMIKQDNQWQETDWQTALEYVAHGLQNIKHEHGADAIAALATPHSTIEELSLLQKIVRGIGSDNVDFRLRQSDFSLDGKITPWLGMSIADFAQLKQIFVVGSFLRKDHPLLTSRVRQAVKLGAKLSILHATDDDLLMPVSNKIIQAPSDWLSILGEIIVAVSQEKNTTIPAEFANLTPSNEAKSIASELLMDVPKAIFIGNAASQHPYAGQLHAAIEWLSENTGSKFGYLTEAANTVGGYLANAIPVNGTNAAQFFTAPRKAYLLLNAEPAFDCANPQAAVAALKQAQMVVVMSAFKHALDYADVLLPIAPFTETSGSYVNCEGRVQSFNGTVKPLGETRPGWKVLRVLGNLLDIPDFNYESSEVIRDEIVTDKVFSGRLNNNAKTQLNVPALTENPGLQRIADVPIYFTDAIVRRAASLQKTSDATAPLAYLSSTLFAKLGLQVDDKVIVRQGSGSATLKAAIGVGQPEHVVRVAAGHPSTADLSAMFGSVVVERA